MNPIRRRIFRSRITRSENIASALLVLGLVIAGVWVLAQRDNYDPSERDLSIEALQQGSIAQLPYEAPLRRWREPGEDERAGPLVPEPFPDTLLAGGWRLDGRVESYDPSTLYEKINGQAEQYLSFGFRELDYLTLEKDGRYLTLELYDQGEFKNALGVFASQRDPSQRVDRLGAVYYYRTSVGAIGLCGPRFFKIVGSEEDDGLQRKTEQLLTVLTELPREAGDADEAFAFLTDRLELPFDDVSFVNRNVFQYDFLDETWFGELGEPDGARAFLHRAKDSARANELFARLVDEQDYEFTAVESGEGSVLLRHDFIGSFFAVAHRGEWLYGVDGAPDPAAAKRVLRRLDEELP